jgi:hypothetical protein
MNNLKSFSEMSEDKFDYEKIIRTLKKTHGWGMGVLNHIDDFESNKEYFQNPEDDNEYVENFHIYLSDLENNRLRGDFNNDSSLRVGRWNTGVQVNNPKSIWSRRM